MFFILFLFMSKIKPVVNINEQYFDVLFYKVNNTYLYRKHKF